MYEGISARKKALKLQSFAENKIAHA